MIMTINAADLESKNSKTLDAFSQLPTQIVKDNILSVIPQGRVDKKTNELFEEKREAFDAKQAEKRQQSSNAVDHLFNTTTFNNSESPSYWQSQLQAKQKRVLESEDGTIHADVLYATLSERRPTGITADASNDLAKEAILKANALVVNDLFAAHVGYSANEIISKKLLRTISNIATQRAEGNEDSIEAHIAQMAQQKLGTTSAREEKSTFDYRNGSAAQLKEIEEDYIDASCWKGCGKAWTTTADRDPHFDTKGKVAQLIGGAVGAGVTAAANGEANASMLGGVLLGIMVSPFVFVLGSTISSSATHTKEFQTHLHQEGERVKQTREITEDIATEAVAQMGIIMPSDPREAGRFTNILASEQLDDSHKRIEEAFASQQPQPQEEQNFQSQITESRQPQEGDIEMGMVVGARVFLS